MKLAFGLFSLLCMVMIFGCKPSIDSQKVEQLNTQINEVDQTLNQLHLIDTLQVYVGLQELMFNVQYIQKNHADTMSFKTAQFLSKYYDLVILLDDFRSYKTVEQDLMTNKNQLEDLKHDYLNGILAENKFTEYYTIEKNHLLILQEKVQKMESKWTIFEEKSREYNPKVDSIVNFIETKRNSLRL